MNRRMQLAVGGFVAGVIFITMAYAAANTAPWQEATADTEESIDGIVQNLFTDHVVAFEILGVLLTAAMIGALVIARPLSDKMDSEVYSKATPEELARSQAVSELKEGD